MVEGMSWNEIGQIGVDHAKEGLRIQNEEFMLLERKRNNQLKEKIEQTNEISEIIKLRADRAERAVKIAQQEVTKAREVANNAQQEAENAKREAALARQEAEKYKQLLSRPFYEIAEVNGNFKTTYEQQQQVLSQWVLSQKAYRETAMQLGLKLDMTPNDVKAVMTPNDIAVLENKTQFENNAEDTPVLKKYASEILALRKKSTK